MGALLKINLKVFFFFFFLNLCKSLVFPGNSPGELFHRLFLHGEVSNRKT